MKLSIVIPTLNQHELTRTCLSHIANNLTREEGYETEIILIDNGSEVPYSENEFYRMNVRIVRNERNTGVYPTFEQGFREAAGEIVAFFHSDVPVYEDGWNKRVIDEFRRNPKLGLVGFIGSDEIDSAGGRGLGTSSNFLGHTITDGERFWKGSKAEVHGRRLLTSMRSAVVDGCVMILRRAAWDTIGGQKDMAPHHFYDKLISCQILEQGWEIETLGVAFDHISGQTANQEPKYQESMREWCEARGIPMNGSNWDETVYRYSEANWLREYRDEKHLIPIKV